MRGLKTTESNNNELSENRRHIMLDEETNLTEN
jgi:hypothetical protein